MPLDKIGAVLRATLRAGPKLPAWIIRGAAVAHPFCTRMCYPSLPMRRLGAASVSLSVSLFCYWLGNSIRGATYKKQKKTSILIPHLPLSSFALLLVFPPFASTLDPVSNE